ncbi:unnamed protein product [Caretta caretta]
MEPAMNVWILEWLKCHKTENIFDWLILNMNRAFSRKKDKTWMHTPEALSKHYIPYNAKFLGSTEVEQPKGTEVVRDAVRKLKFARHIKKSEGQKTPKVELQISIYGVKILDPKTKEVQHNCQLHRISFCADDKTDKRIFTFICKDSESNKHLCYVFDSEKCAEEITLTIGQAFDLAYRKFLESGGKDVETRKQIAGLQKRIQELETENIELKNKVQDLENQLRINQIHTSPAGSVTPKSPSTDIFDMVPFSPISPQSSTPTRNGTQPPPVPSRSAEIKRDLFGAEPFDPFSCGAGDFPPDIQSKLDEMQEGFKMGLTLEGTVFCLDPLDSSAIDFTVAMTHQVNEVLDLLAAAAGGKAGHEERTLVTQAVILMSTVISIFLFSDGLSE